ncbi:MAG: type I pullulanase [Caloramator sp.]|nr:type I pullulanase [Caloramator sp.]
MFTASVIDFNKIKIVLEKGAKINHDDLIIKNGEKLLNIEKIIIDMDCTYVLLKDEINIKYYCFVTYKSTTIKALYTEIFNSKSFNERYYTELPLGCIFNKSSCLFRVWSPAATSVNLLLYKNGDSQISETPKRLKMYEENGLWSLNIEEDLEGLFYTYEVEVYGIRNEAVDPYAKAVSINGLRGAIIDLNKTNPDNFLKEEFLQLNNFTEAIIYEVSIRDMSMHPDSGIKHKGKFLGLTEENTKSSKGLSTGLSHILELGVTHVQLMPIYDFSYTITDEKNPVNYNWGYDPQNYNVPEGSYSTDAYNPKVRIFELKTLIHTLHKHGLGVNMDVVFNHVYDLKNDNLEKIFPGYYFRFSDDGTPSNGSACSNDTASERAMMRRFIIDSVYYFAKEYHIDGFRFDLMGLHDVTTMNLIREKLNTLGRPIMLYGEGWVLNTLLSEDIKANQLNSCKMPHIGHFNDVIRDAVRGSVFIKEDKGFVSGKENMEDKIKYCVTGCTDYFNTKTSLFQTPDQSINYVSAHDNNTLWDKLNLSNPEDDIETLKSMQKLSNAIVLTSQGIPFLHSGVEFCRTKYNVEDSVHSEDYINWMDWERKFEFLDVFNYYKGLIKLRKEHSAFKMNSIEHIKNHLEFLDSPKNTVAFILKNHANNDIWKDIIVIYNSNRKNVNITIPQGNWNIVTDNNTSGTNIIRSIRGNSVEVKEISMMVLYR